MVADDGQDCGGVAQMSILGVDVSHWQGAVDWDLMVQRGVRFAILKMTEAATYKDDTFERNYNACKVRNITVGAYHFVRMNIDAQEQYANIVDSIGDRNLGIFALDCETNDGQSARTCTKVIRSLATKCQGIGGVQYPTIYTRKSWWDIYVQPSSDWATLPLWVAHWDAVYPMLPADWTHHTIWQYTVLKNGSSYGVQGGLDLNKWNEAIPFPGSQEDPEPVEDVITGNITINGVRYKLVRAD